MNKVSDHLIDWGYFWELWQDELALVATLVVCLLAFLLIGKRSESFLLVLAGIGLVFTSLIIIQQPLDWGQKIKLLVLGSGIFHLGFFRNSFSGIVQFGHTVTHLTLFLGMVLGTFFMVDAEGFLELYLGLEILSISSYLMVAIEKRNWSSEAAIKFFVFGAFSSAITLFGFSVMYSQTGITLLPELLTNLKTSNPHFLFGYCLSLSGFLFKSTLFPFHFWAADVFQGTSFRVLALLTTVSKIAGIYVVVTWIVPALAFFPETNLVYLVFVGSIALSIIIGNLSALGQVSFNRLMAYSSVSQSGFLLLIGTIPHSSNLELILYFLVVIVCANLLVFLSASKVFNSSETIVLTCFNGLGKSLPFLAIALTIGLITLIGIPPSSGFLAKFFVFSVLLSSASLTVVQIILILIAGIGTVISLYFYLKPVYHMYFKESDKQVVLSFSIFDYTLLMLLILLIFSLFLFPGLIFGL